MRKILVILVLLIISCKSSNNKVVIKKATIEQVESLGLDLQRAVDKDDIIGINALYDEKALAERFLLKSSKRQIHEFNLGFFSGFSRSFSFGEIIIKEKSKGASYNYLNVYQDKNNNYHLLFRMIGEGLNYHDHLVKIVNGIPKIVDTYIYLTGENLSETFKKIYKNVLRNTEFYKNNVDDITILKDMKKLEDIRNLMANQNFKEAHKIYKTVSNSSKSSKLFKLVHISMTSSISEQLYADAIKDYELSYPKDPSLQLVSIDGYIINKQFDKALKSINVLEESIHGDSFLNYLRGNVLFHDNKFDESLEMFTKVNSDFPDFIDAYESKLAIYLEKKNHKGAVDILHIFNTKFQISKEEINANVLASFPIFTKTNFYKNWYSKS